MTSNKAGTFLAQIALKSGRNPLTALGVPAEYHDLPELSRFVLELIMPPEDGKLSESEYDEKAQEIKERQDREDNWHAAIHTAYQGPRGQAEIMVKLLPDLAAPTHIPIHTGRQASMES